MRDVRHNLIGSFVVDGVGYQLEKVNGRNGPRDRERLAVAERLVRLLGTNYILSSDGQQLLPPKEPTCTT